MHRVTRLFLEKIQNLGFTPYYVHDIRIEFNMKGYMVTFIYHEKLGAIFFMFDGHPRYSEIVFKDWGMAEQFIQKNCFI